MGRYVLGLEEIDQTEVAAVGGKGAHLGEVSRVAGVCVPPGFCVTTDAFDTVVSKAPSFDHQLERLLGVDPDDRDEIRSLSAAMRQTLEGLAIPDDVAAAISDALDVLGDEVACAVRSSATAEDSRTSSFAGQHDTYLNVVGPAAVLEQVRRCWASLFTERAVSYRTRNGIDHRTVRMAVVVQQMVPAQASGVLFTADPVTSNRKIAVVEACFGLGEALVSGLVNADVYRVRDGEVISEVVANKPRAVFASPARGTHEAEIEPERRQQPVLTDAQVVRLTGLGRRIEAHFGYPQDIEWCLVDDGFYVVQSRPITTLYPIPDAGDGALHVYVSVGHGQMMTDAMKPLGLSVWQLTAARPMYTAGGRLFVDIARGLASPASRAGLLEVLGKGDPLIGDALATMLERGDVVPLVSGDAPGGPPTGRTLAPIETDPALVTELIARSEASVAALKRDIQTKSGSALLDFILADIEELKRILFSPESQAVIMASMEATWWLNDQLEAWLGEKNVADTLTQSVPHNITSEMGLALLHVADVIRPHPDVIAFLQHVENNDFLDELVNLPGGRQARDTVGGYLDRYGMRCTGEIDITRPRWSEDPTTLLPIILADIKNFEPGAGERRFEQGRQEASKKEQDVLERLRALPDGEPTAEQAKRMIDRVRTFAGYREYPKYGMVSRYFVYKQALLREAERLLQGHVLCETEDIFYLTFEELQDVVRRNHVDDDLVRRRKDEFKSYQALAAPRVMTSDGEIFTGAYRREDVPAGALIGLPDSAGTVEGRARVILDLAEADLEAGDILVTAYTDPSWTPLFLAVKGLVTEVGGLMSHGAVIAREYGLPAVVGVEGATRLIRDGQRIRVNGSEGYVEILR